MTSCRRKYHVTFLFDGRPVRSPGELCCLGPAAGRGSKHGGRRNGAPTNYGVTQEQGIQRKRRPAGAGAEQQGTRERANNEWNDRNESPRTRRPRLAREIGGREIRFGEPTQDGLTISRVEQGSHYYRSGLRDGDVIISYNGQPLHNQDEFGRWANERSSERMPVIVLRDGRRETVYIQYENDRERVGRSYANNAGSVSVAGVFGRAIRDAAAGGAVISAVVPGSPAEEAGLQPGDELVSINGRRDQLAARSRRESCLRCSRATRSTSSTRVRRREHAQAVLKEHPGDVASARYQRERRNRQGATQYDGIEQSSYDQESAIGATNETSDRAVRRRARRRAPRRRAVPAAAELAELTRIMSNSDEPGDRRGGCPRPRLFVLKGSAVQAAAGPFFMERRATVAGRI